MSLPESPGKKDRRLYAKFDIGMDEHAKIMFLSDAAFRALFESTLYSRRQLTDGFLDGRIVMRKWGAEVVAELTSNDPERPSWRVVDGGYMIHDYAEHQTTTADIEAKRENGRKGGLAKAKQLPSETEAPAKHVLDVCSSNTLAKTETETETETETSLFAVPDTREAKPKSNRKTSCPKEFPVTDSMASWAKENGINADLKYHTAKFLDHHAAKGTTFVDWTRAWQNWMRNSKEWAKPAAADNPTIPAQYGWANR